MNRTLFKDDPLKKDLSSHFEGFSISKGLSNISTFLFALLFCFLKPILQREMQIHRNDN